MSFPYFLIGPAINVSQETGGNGKFERTQGGLQAGVGLDVPFGRRGMFFELKYISLPPGAILPFVVGFRF